MGSRSVFVTYDPPAEIGFSPPPELAQITAKYGSAEISPIKIDVKEPVDNLEVKLD